MLYKLIKCHNWNFETIVDIQAVNGLFCISNEKWAPMYFLIEKENSDELLDLIDTLFNKEPLVVKIYKQYKEKITIKKELSDGYKYFISELEKRFSDIILLYEMGCQR